MGNPETDDYYDYKGLLEYAWSHAVISDLLYENAKQVCDFKLFNWSEECNRAMSEVFKEYREIDIYNIYAPRCLINNNNTKSNSSNTKSFTEVLILLFQIMHIYSLCHQVNYILRKLIKDFGKIFTLQVMNSYGLRKMRIFGGYDPCYSTYAEEYFNRLDVQLSLHANIDGKSQVKWKVCK